MPSQTVPAGNLEVQRIMRERGVGMKHAYAIAKREAALAIDTSSVTSSQKQRILRALITHSDVSDSNTLMSIMHAEGDDIDGHDLVKMLWAAQKSGWITFRERKSLKGTKGDSPIYGIRIRDAGLTAYARNWVEDDRPPNGAALAEAEVVKHLDGPEAEVTYTDQGEPMYERPTVQEYIESAIEHLPEAGTIALEAYPLVTALVARAKKVDRLASAAKILELAGEDDLALQVMDRVSINPFEKEVVALVRAVFGEEDQ